MNASLIEMGLKMSLALGAVLIVFAAAIFIARKVSTISQGKKNRSGLRRTQIDILGVKALSPGKQLLVIAVDGKRFLLGSTQQQISKIAELEDEEAVEEAAENNFNFRDSLRDSENRDSHLADDIKNRLGEITRV
jgi:flagellar biogenesis protein FliO